MTAKKILRLSIGFILAALFLYLTLHKINTQDILATLRQASYAWLLMALIAFFIGYAMRILRWRIMLNIENPSLDWQQCAGPFLASFALNNVLPFRAGDLLRSVAYNQRLGTSTSGVLATLLVERMLDFLMVIAFLALALYFFELQGIPFLKFGSLTLMLFAGIIICLLLMPGLFAKPLAVLVTISQRLAPQLATKLRAAIDNSLHTLQQLAQGGVMLRLILCSMLAWFAEGLLFLFTALALPTLAQPLASWLALPVGTLATLIPSTPGYVGTFDFFISQAMTTLNNSLHAATAYALLVHILLWLPPTLLGGLYLFIKPIQIPHRE